MKLRNKALVLTLCSLLGAVAASHANELSAASGSAMAGPGCVAASHANELSGAGLSINRGLTWLAAQQRENGSWGNQNYPAMTALAMWAFCRSDYPERDSICSNAAIFVAGFAQSDGGIYKPAKGRRGSGGLSTYNTAICMTVLHEYDTTRFVPLILKARDFMRCSQIVSDSPSSGGFGYEVNAPTKGKVSAALLRKAAAEERTPPDESATPRMAQARRADLSNTGWALMAMRQTQDIEDLRSGTGRIDLNWDLALEYIDKLQDKDSDDAVNYGGFGYEGSGARGSTVERPEDGKVKLRGFGSMTYAGLESMIYAQVDRSDPRVRSALQWAARHWSVDENPGMGSKGLFYYYNVMGKAMNVCDVDVLINPDDHSTINWRSEIVAELIEKQHADGSWVNQDGSFWENDPILVTSYSVLTLQYALDERR